MVDNYTERDVVVLDTALLEFEMLNIRAEDILKTLNDPDKVDSVGASETATRSINDTRKLTITYSYASTLDTLEKPIILEKVKVEDQ